MGFKDKNGVVKIEPKFSGVTTAGKFENIVAVTEEINGTWNSYYLTKTGRIVGRDSLHIFDNAADCENEGFIRFHDRKTDQVGMFDKKGDITIPADYSALSKVTNGMIIALKDAKKEQMGEHYSWSGGTQILIDTNNNTLIDNFQYDENVNFYSVRISSQPNPDTIRRNFKGVNGQYYSFVDYDKEFRAWLKSSLLDHFTKPNLLNCSYKEIYYWIEPAGWTPQGKNRFVDRNFDIIKKKLLALNSKECEYHISNEGLNPFIYDFQSDEFKNYFNNCGESKDWLYPMKNIVISYKDNKDLVQDHFEFLRTDNGYKLISISIKKGKLR